MNSSFEFLIGLFLGMASMVLIPLTIVSGMDFMMVIPTVILVLAVVIVDRKIIRK